MGRIFSSRRIGFWSAAGSEAPRRFGSFPDFSKALFSLSPRHLVTLSPCPLAVWFCRAVTLCLFLPLLGGRSLAQEEATNWPIYQLKSEQQWQINLPRGERFDASGLFLMTNGDLLTLSDTGPTLYKILLPGISNSVNLQPLTNCFAPLQMGHLAPYNGHYDSEGIAQDDQGRLYICEEGNRWILRCNPQTGRVEVLPIDWTPVKQFFSTDRNASFEGIAIGNGKLYVANERSDPVIIEVDLKTLKVTNHFVVWPRTSSLLGVLHYSDLSWFDGKLYVLCRHHRVVLEVNPQTHDVLAEFNYRDLEDKLEYKTVYPTGTMEGLAVDHNFIWLVTDNNGLGRMNAPKDIRPTLVKCKRPGVQK
jgi:uncharacterized protein YjiK